MRSKSLIAPPDAYPLKSHTANCMAAPPFSSLRKQRTLAGPDPRAEAPMPHRDAPDLQTPYSDGAVMDLVRGDSPGCARVNRQSSPGLDELRKQPHGEPPFGKGSRQPSHCNHIRPAGLGIL